jgi:hypothetical protein
MKREDRKGSERGRWKGGQRMERELELFMGCSTLEVF